MTLANVLKMLRANMEALAKDRDKISVAREALERAQTELISAGEGSTSTDLDAVVRILADALQRLETAETALRQTAEGFQGYIDQVTIGAPPVDEADSAGKPHDTAEEAHRSPAPPVSVSTLRPLVPRTPSAVEHLVVEWAVSCAIEVCVNGWQTKVADQLASVITPEDWQLWRKRDAGDCEKLAAAAEAIQLGLENVTDFVVTQAEAVVVRAGFDQGPAALLAATFGKLLELAGEHVVGRQVIEVVRSIRVLGVAMCAVEGTLETCPCLDVLIRDFIKAITREVVLIDLLRPGLVASGGEAAAMPS